MVSKSKHFKVGDTAFDQMCQTLVEEVSTCAPKVSSGGWVVEAHFDDVVIARSVAADFPEAPIGRFVYMTDSIVCRFGAEGIRDSFSAYCESGGFVIQLDDSTEGDGGKKVSCCVKDEAGRLDMSEVFHEHCLNPKKSKSFSEDGVEEWWSGVVPTEVLDSFLEAAYPKHGVDRQLWIPRGKVGYLEDLPCDGNRCPDASGLNPYSCGWALRPRSIDYRAPALTADQVLGILPLIWRPDGRTAMRSILLPLPEGDYVWFTLESGLATLYIEVHAESNLAACSGKWNFELVG